MDSDISRPHVDCFSYEDSKLHVEGVAIETVALEYGTPVYIYSAEAVRRRWKLLSDAVNPLGIQICYAMKTNNNLSLLRILAGLGAGVDLVSGGELERARAAGIPGEKMVFSGVGKTSEEIRAALEADVHQLNVESIEELEAIDEVASALGKIATVVLRINPHIDAGTHPKITTGTRKNKFGIDYHQVLAIYELAARSPHINLVGLAVHIGSQITDLTPFRQSFERLSALVEMVRQRGYTVERLDLGGGLGVDYGAGQRIDVEAYAKVIGDTLGDCDCALTIEPGRFLIAEAGALITTVIYNKETDGERFSIVDAGMNDLMRPALYDSLHPVWPIMEPTADQRATPCHLVGPVCESSDTFGRFTYLPRLERGDRVAIGVAGAYGAAMASTYNARPLVQEVLVDGDRYSLIRRKQTVADQLQYELTDAGHAL
jgi:diaminopimelate decarboxylase